MAQADDSEGPRFLEWREADLTAWRQDERVQAFIEFLHWERIAGLENVLSYTKTQKPHDAAIVAGAVHHIESLLLLLHRKDPPPQAQDEEFVDPAMPPTRPRRKE